MNGIESAQKVGAKRQRVAVDEFERISGLRLDIDPDDIEPGLVIAHAGAARAAK